ncbi:hypothetical protein RhiirA4_466138 [Rhizophagus irregularis]|uniref:Uncharacterized protein n=1 Tax=Rhizophagus irregularis TaxID=588596 RepID=A0A2I1GTK4_9GLOM|nr:hypothetical protein RhiirA4_466138 [Rhizophagus irregularis]
MDDISVKISDDANKIEIDVDKIDIDKIDIDKIDIDKIDVDKIDIDKIDVDKIDVDKIDVDKIDVDKNDDKIFTFDNELHNGNPITIIGISPNEKYLITHGGTSFIGWNVEDIDKIKLKIDRTTKILNIAFNLCVSNDKKLVFDSNESNIDIIDINSKDKKIALSFDKNVRLSYYTFNLKGEFILYGEVEILQDT